MINLMDGNLRVIIRKKEIEMKGKYHKLTNLR